MRTHWRILPLALVFIVAACARGGRPDDRAQSPEPFDQPDSAMDYYVTQRAPAGSADVPVERYAVALAQRAKMQPARAAKLGQTVWTDAGPDNIGGRTRALLIDPVDPQRMYAAGVSGGVWVSSNGGQSWSFTGESFANLATVALAMDPSDRDVLYAGTGEGVYVNRPTTRSRGVRGDGIFVTEDGANTWRQLAATRGNPDFDYVNDLQFDGAGRLYAATRTGVWLTTDRGETWTRSAAAPNGDGCNDLAYSSSSNRIIVACGSFSGGALLTGSDSAGWATLALAANSGRTKLAVAPSNPSIVYGLTAHQSDYGFWRVLRSNDGGATFATVQTREGADVATSLLHSSAINLVNDDCSALAAPIGGQGWFDNALAVDPVNPDVVWAGGVDLYRSDDGGRRFRLASFWWFSAGYPRYVHADQHALVFDPRYDGIANQTLWVGNDGGIFRTAEARAATSPDLCNDEGAIDWESFNTGYRVTQFYHGAASADGAVLIAGAQDNGTSLGRRDQASWDPVYGGDGAYCAIDPGNPLRLYLGTQFGAFRRSDDGGDTSRSIRSGLPPVGELFGFIAPLALDPQQPDTLWTGAGNAIYRSTNRGDQWQATTTSAVDPLGGKLSAIASAPAPAAPARVLLAGYDSGTIARSTDGGATWATVRPRPGVVSSVSFDPARSGTAWATYSTFGGAHLWRSSDAGATWNARDGSVAGFALPDVPAHTLLADPRDATQLYLGTDIGLFFSPDDGARWYADASGLGNVLVEHLASTGTGENAELVAFTYGRGAFRARLADLGATATNPGLSGLWYEPATDGQGFQVEVNADAGQVVVGWYTHLPTGATPSRSNHVWLIGNAALADAAATVPMYRTNGGRFDDGTATVTQVGNVEIDFADCVNGTARYAITLGGTALQGEIPLTRLTPDVLCAEYRARGDGALSAIAVDQQPGDFEYGHSGTWYEPATDGQGLLFEVDSSRGLMQASWYTYDFADPLGNGTQSATWFLAQGGLAGPRADLVVYRTTGGAFDAGNAVTTTPIGTLTLTAESCQAVRADYALDSGGVQRSGTLALRRLTGAGICDRAAP